MKPNVTSRSDDDLLGATEAAGLLPDTTRATLLRWGREGRVPVVRLPGRVYFRRRDIEALLEPVLVGSDKDEVIQPQLPFEALREPRSQQ